MKINTMLQALEAIFEEILKEAPEQAKIIVLAKEALE